MSRLIDADKLQEDLEKVKKESATLVDILHIIEFQIVVDAQPTAFDVDKVVKQLEESYFITESTFDDDGWCNDDSEEVVNLNEAIEIVKRGGKGET